MKILKEYNLNFEKVVEYVNEYLKDGNEIAQYVQKNLDFSTGYFSAFSSVDINIDSIYDLKSGGLIKADYTNRKSNIVPIPNVDKELSEYICRKYHMMQMQILFEDILRNSHDPDIEIQGVQLLIINNHVNYLIEVLSEDCVFETLKTTKEVWYSFFIITSGLSEITYFSPNDFQIMLKNIKQFYIGAYDGEGYVSWTKR